MLIGYTAGVFDLFHIGHLNLLKNAKGMCDKLIVGVTSDELATYKGKYPVIPFSDRIEIIRNLRCVDAVVAQTDMNKLEMCKKLQAKIMFVGDDWYRSPRWEEYEKEFAEAGIQIMYFPYTKGVSSTQISKALKHLHGENRNTGKPMETDLRYCMNSYLQYRTVVDQRRRFYDNISPWYYKETNERIPVNTAEELDIQLRRQIERALECGSVGLMLSSGMDSAILASYLPEGTRAYTLHCQAESGIDETEKARVYAERNGLRHSVVEVYWEDFQKYTLPLMKQKGYPIHSIEVQIYKAALQARKDGIKTLIFGETADIIYGGHSKLLSQDWKLEAFTDRFSFVDTAKVLRHPMRIQDPILPYVKEDGNVDVFQFLNGFEYGVSLGFYTNACRLAGVELCAPYSYTILGHTLDYDRIRMGESKYVVRELYQRIYPDIPVPEKTPLPRPMTEWLRDWKGPFHQEIIPEHISELTGDQKWYVYALNEFLLHIRGEECKDAIFETGTAAGFISDSEQWNRKEFSNR